MAVRGDAWRCVAVRGGVCAFATMCRSECFPVGAHNRLRSRRGSPLELWNMLAAEIPKWLKDEVSAGMLRLPTEAECLSMQPP